MYAVVPGCGDQELLDGSTEVVGDGTHTAVTRPWCDHDRPAGGEHHRAGVDSWAPTSAHRRDRGRPGALNSLYGYIGRHDLTAERSIAIRNTDGSVVIGPGPREMEQHRPAGASGPAPHDQVKIRGYRIEVDEIRTIIEDHHQVSSAAVIAADHPAGGKYLAAYYTTYTDGQGTSAPTSMDEIALIHR